MPSKAKWCRLCLECLSGTIPSGSRWGQRRAGGLKNDPSQHLNYRNDMKSENAAADILDAAIRSRRSVRAFRPDPVPKRLLMEIIETARAAPSNFNSQPWSVHVLVGKAKQALGEAITQAYHSNAAAPFS